MKILPLFFGVILLVMSIVILFTEMTRDTMGIALGMCVVAGWLFRAVTEED